MQVINDVIKKYGVAGLIFVMWVMTIRENSGKLEAQAKFYSEVIKIQNEKETRNFEILHEMLSKMGLTNERLGNVELQLQNIKENIRSNK